MYFLDIRLGSGRKDYSATQVRNFTRVRQRIECWRGFLSPLILLPAP